jgi:hypothetical protein
VTALQLTNWATLVGVVVAALALVFTAYGIHRSNQNSSAAALIALNEGLRQAWKRFLTVTDEQNKQHEFAELLNSLEIACALCVKGVFVGVSRELLTEYLSDVIDLFDANEDAKRRAEALIHSKTTFKYLALYRSTVRKRLTRRRIWR